MTTAEITTTLDANRIEFLEQMARMPDTSLTYLRDGEDYAIGGILVHVEAVIANYGTLLSQLIDNGFQPMDAVHDEARDKAVADRARAGLTGPEREQMVADINEMHAAFVARLTSLDAERRTTTVPVMFSGPEPFPTSPNAIATWISDHYQEHIAQLEELLIEWEVEVEDKR